MTIDQTVRLPAAISAGSYDLLLDLPDPRLGDRPEYSIRLDGADVWEASTGYNDLLHSLTVRR